MCKILLKNHISNDQKNYSKQGDLKNKLILNINTHLIHSQKNATPSFLENSSTHLRHRF